MRAPRWIVYGSFAIAFAVRLAWALKVQSPFDSVYSDMRGYVERAEWLLAHTTPAEPRILTAYPPGTHCILALEFLVFGRNARLAIAIVHSLVGAVPAACIAALTPRLVPGRAAAALVGLLTAFWYPQVCFVGFFSTEVWFSAAIAVHACLFARDAKRARGLLAMALVSVVAIVVRPQFLMTWALETGASVLSFWRRRGMRVAARNLAWLGVPVALALAITTVRFHALAGHWGLMSESAANRLWADTDVCKIESKWQAPNGDAWGYTFSPPSKPPRKPSDTVTFDGYIIDPVLLDGIRLERMRGVSLHARIARKLGNVRLLVAGNLPWPESNYQDDISFLGLTPSITRHRLQSFFADLLVFGVLPWSAIGIAFGRRNRTMLILVANLVTVVFSAAFFFGEARYHVPYDPFLILLAVAGFYEFFKSARTFASRLRFRRAIARSARALRPT